MNLNSIAHPELFFIEDFNILLDPENNFLENLDDYLSAVQDLEISILNNSNLVQEIFEGLPWSKKFETILGKQKLISLSERLYFIFKKFGDTLDTIGTEPCDSNPELNFFNEKILKDTKKLITSSKEKEDVYFVSSSNSNYDFSHMGKKLKVDCVQPNEFYRKIDSYENWWPRSKNEFEINLKNCIQIYMKKNAKDSINTYAFSGQFKSNFLDTQKRFKNEIVKTIGNRISKTQQKAALDRTLNDEYIQEVKKRRIRVTQSQGGGTSTRIMYTYIDKLDILFDSFDTDHDKSLKNKK